MLCSQFIFPPTLPGGFPDGTMIKNPPANAGDARDLGSIPGSGRSPRVGNGNPLQYCCLENSTEEPGGLQSMGLQELDMIEYIHTTVHEGFPLSSSSSTLI